MGLTRPRASQIYDLDYKQATRVVTTANINLAGGAPSQVDGVNLSTNDRILVVAQDTPSQNGIYYVTTVGTGSSGTWARSQDTNATGELDAGTIVMVTEGVIYADTQWKLITDNPIVIGTTPLVFTQNYSANSISGGTSNVTVYSNANVTISSAGVPNVAIVANTGLYVSGIVSTTGNIFSTGSVQTLANIYADNFVALTNIDGGNINLSGNISLAGNITSNDLLAYGNVSADYFIGNGSLLSGLPETYGNTQVAEFLPTYTGNIGAGNVTATGNISGDYFIGNGSQLTGINVSTSTIFNGTSNIEIATANSNITMSIAGIANTVVISPGEITVDGVYSNPKTITSNVVITENVNSMMVGPVDVGPTGNIYVPDSSTLKIL